MRQDLLSCFLDIRECYFAERIHEIPFEEKKLKNISCYAGFTDEKMSSYLLNCESVCLK